MRIRLVHKASGSYGGRPAASDTTKTERTSTPATMGTSSHDPSASNLDSTDNSFALDQLPDGFDADVGPYDPDNDYFPDENMTDAEAAEEAARLRQEEIKESREFNKKNHGDLPPEPKQKSRRAKASASGKQPAASSAGPLSWERFILGMPFLYEDLPFLRQFDHAPEVSVYEVLDILQPTPFSTTESTREHHHAASNTGSGEIFYSIFNANPGQSIMNNYSSTYLYNVPTAKEGPQTPYSYATYDQGKVVMDSHSSIYSLGATTAEEAPVKSSKAQKSNNRPKHMKRACKTCTERKTKCNLISGSDPMEHTMAGDRQQTGIDAFKGYVPICPRPLAGSEGQANAQIDAPGNPHAVSMQTPATSPIPAGLRHTCDPCRLLHRTCRNGSPTKPCDRCVERKVTCVFRPCGSFVEERKRKRKRKSTAEEPEAEPEKKKAKNGSVSAPGFDPTALGLRRRCNYCHLRAHSCVNGSNTTPCDNCKQRNLICTFGARKSIIDKESFRTITDEDYTQAHNLGQIADGNYYTQEQYLRQITAENYNQEHYNQEHYNQELNLRQITDRDCIQEHNDVTVANPTDILEQQQMEVGEVEVGEPQVGMPMMVLGNDGEYIRFSQEDLRVPEEHTMHPWEILAARNSLVYDLQGLQYEIPNVEMDEE
ncbi:hypothetical protein KCU95_g3137, partial [Aureobasidium melanogenum]